MYRSSQVIMEMEDNRPQAPWRMPVLPEQSTPNPAPTSPTPSKAGSVFSRCVCFVLPVL